MARAIDGPATTQFKPVEIRGNASWKALAKIGVSRALADAAEHAPRGGCVCAGLPFRVGRPVVLNDKAVTLALDSIKAAWLVFMHTSDLRPLDANSEGLISPMRGQGRLAEHAADYVIVYADGSEERLPVRRRHQLGAFNRRWGENCFESIVHQKMRPIHAHHEQPCGDWGSSQTRAGHYDSPPWTNWLWAWENPNPRKAIVAVRLEPVSGAIVLSAVSAGKASSLPLRWRRRRKALLTLPRGQQFDPTLDDEGRLEQIRLDMGQVISAQLQPQYPNDAWAKSYNNQLPEFSGRQVLVEYTAHEDAAFHLAAGKSVPVARLEERGKSGSLEVVEPATQRVELSVVEKGTGRPVTVKLHIHGQAGEYLAPLDRHRIPNPAWFEDYAPDFLHQAVHYCTYIPGETTIDLPVGRVYIEVSRGFEMKPVRKVVRVGKGSKKIALEIEKGCRGGTKAG